MAAKKESGASYGAASREEHIRSGNVLPKSAYVDAESDGSGEPSAEERQQIAAMDAASPVVANKVVIPKAPARKKQPARKSGRKR